MKIAKNMFTACLLVAAVLTPGHAQAETDNFTACTEGNRGLKASTALTTFCIETGHNGELIAGRMPQDVFQDLFEILIEKAIELGFDVQMFKVQQADGYYGKVCNSIEHKNNFFHVFQMDGWNESHWSCQFRSFTTDEADEIITNPPLSNDEIMRIDITQHSGNIVFRFCQYLGGIGEFFTQTDIDAAYESGRQACITNPASVATISEDLAIHIPYGLYNSLLGPLNLWADFRVVPGTNEELRWELSDYGLIKK